MLPAALCRADVPASQPDIAALIEQLGSDSFREREAAERALIEIGPPAFAALREAASSDDAEVALRARRILGVYRDLLLVGARVRLEIHPEQVAWNEPAELTVIIENPSDLPCWLPFSADVLEGDPAVPAVHVGRMLDIADFLEVLGPDGERIDLHVDDVREDSAVEAAVDLRASGHVPAAALDPGQSVRVSLPLNRGWARYPLLEAGIYTIRFAYRPSWERVRPRGLADMAVTSPPVRLTVRTAAPEAVRTVRAPLRIEVLREGDRLIGRLRACDDQPIIVNLNFGRDNWLHARLEWVLPWGEDDTLTVPAAGTDNPPFRPDLLHTLEPDATVTLVEMPVADLINTVREHYNIPPARLEVRLRYTNFCSRSYLEMRLRSAQRPPDDPVWRIRRDLPPNIVSGWFVSEPVVVDVPPGER